MIHIIHTPAAMRARQRQAQALRAFALVLPPWVGVMLWAYLTPLLIPSGNADSNFTGITFIPVTDNTNTRPAPRPTMQVSRPEVRADMPVQALTPNLPGIHQPQLPALPDIEPDEYLLDTDAETLLATPEPRLAPQPGHASPTTAAAGPADHAPYTPPAYSQCPKPPYPPHMRRQRVQGSVVIILCISAEGAPTTGEISQSSGNASLDQHALNWVLNHWRFTPARRNNTVCEARISTTLHFNL